MRHGKRELCNAPSKGKPCWGGIEQASPDYRGCEMPYAHNMVHIDRKGVHGSLPPPRHMERLRWQAAAAEQFWQASQRGRDQESSR